MNSRAKSLSEDDYDVAVIGAGLIGLSTADALSRGGAKVVVADIQNSVMQGASHSNSGMVHPSQSAPWSSLGLTGDARLSAAKDVYSLAVESAVLIKTRAAELGLAQSSRETGCLQIFQSTTDWDIACARFDALGVRYKRRPAGVLFGDRPAIFFEGDSSGNAFDYGVALADDLRARGVDIALGQGASLWSEDGRVEGIRLGDRNIKAAHTVLATGMQSARLASWVGVELPMQRAAGWAVNYDRPDMELPDYPVMDAGSCSALTIFGGTLRLSGTIDAPDETDLLSLWEGLAPDLMSKLGNPLSPARRGERPMSKAGKPFIGRSAVPGLWVNTGHGHMGWTLCAGSGELMARMVLDGESDERFGVIPSTAP